LVAARPLFQLPLWLRCDFLSAIPPTASTNVREDEWLEELANELS
jgi:hypothetical protein